MNQGTINPITPEEIFMTQMKVVYFLLQATIAGSVVCYIFGFIVFGVLLFQGFFFMLYYANTLRADYCKRHNIIRSHKEFIIWKISQVMLTILSCFVVFNLGFTVISIVSDSVSGRNTYYQNLMTTFSDNRKEISISLQLFSVFLQCVITYMFCFKKSIEYSLLKPIDLLNKLIIKDLSLIPDDRSECIICLEEMKPSCIQSNCILTKQKIQKPIQQQVEMIDHVMTEGKKQQLESNIQEIKESSEIVPPPLNNYQSKETQEELTKQFSNIPNFQFLASTNEDENQQCIKRDILQTISVKQQSDEETPNLPQENMDFLYRETTDKKVNISDRVKSLITFSEAGDLDESENNNPPSYSCNNIQQQQQALSNAKYFSKMFRQSSFKSSQIEAEKSTRCCESQYKPDQQEDQTSQFGEMSQRKDEEKDANMNQVDQQESNQLQLQLQSNSQVIVQNVFVNNNNQEDQSATGELQKSTSNIPQIDLPHKQQSQGIQQNDEDNNTNLKQHVNEYTLSLSPEEFQQQTCQTQKEKKIVGFKCKHYFHIDCMKEWLKTSQILRCPTCRQDILP